MIGRADVVERVREWGLREDIVEKDYVLGWVLWGIGTDPVLGNNWIFKGGTCLKKCYIETYRFSEDLDFTVLPGGPSGPEVVLPRLNSILARVGDESGINFTVRAPSLRLRPSGKSCEGRVYYRGPREANNPASIKLDLTTDEIVCRPPVLLRVTHAYPDALPEPGSVRCYSFEELFAEKIRAMAQRGRPRDLYDIIVLFWRKDLRLFPNEIRAVLVEKCAAKGIPVPTYETVASAPHHAELQSEWQNMLGHQLPALPPLDHFWNQLPDLFGWLNGEGFEEPSQPIPWSSAEDQSWTPPPTVATWRVGVPLETVRFAAANHLCVQLGYEGTIREVEPYALRRQRAGNILLHARRTDSGRHRSYRVEKIQSVKATTRPFVPVWPVEFSRSGPLTAPSAVRRLARLPQRFSRGTVGRPHVVRCRRCGREFTRTTRETSIRPHNDPSGIPCRGRSGIRVR